MIKEMNDLIIKRIKDDYKLILINCSARVNLEQEFIEIIGLKLTCESCKYYNGGCCNPKNVPTGIYHQECIDEDFGCIYHERAKND